jgi:transposase
MGTTATQWEQDTRAERRLHVALELSSRLWHVVSAVDSGTPARTVVVAAGDVAALGTEIARAKVRFGLPAAAPVRSCYEAGRDGFWLHRVLRSQGVENVVIDAASIEVDRRARRAKSDRLDGGRLLGLLLRASQGEQRGWRPVRVPTVAEEDRRQVHRELTTMKRERTRLTNRIKGLLAAQGTRLGPRTMCLPPLESLRGGDGQTLPPGLLSRLEREQVRWRLLTEQIHSVEAARAAAVRGGPEPAMAVARRLQQLRGVGPTSAWVLSVEFFSWRRLRTRREVAGLAGLTPTPFRSGQTAHEQGISKAGNRHVRAVAIELAWSWLRYQPASALSQWFAARFAAGSSRLRRIGIVALARRLLIVLWRYSETGLVPEGAIVR